MIPALRQNILITRIAPSNPEPLQAQQARGQELEALAEQLRQHLAAVSEEARRLKEEGDALGAQVGRLQARLEDEQAAVVEQQEAMRQVGARGQGSCCGGGGETGGGRHHGAFCTCSSTPAVVARLSCPSS